MKIKLFIIAFCLSLFSCAQKVENNLIPNTTDLDAVALFDAIATFQNKSKSEIWQVNTRTKNILMHFKYSSLIEDRVYESYFKDKGKTLKDVYKAYEVNNVKGSVSKISSLFVDENNDLYAIVSGLQAQQDPRGVMGVDFKLNPFFVIVQIAGHDSVVNYWPIHNPMLYDEYYLVEIGSFFRTKDGFAVSMFKIEESIDKNIFLAEFKLSNGELVPSHLYENVFIPKYHIKSKFGYGMLNYRTKGDWMMFYSSNSIINIGSGKETELYFDKMLPASPPFNPVKGMSFDIPFICCDFFMDTSLLRVVYRMNNQFYLNTYSLDFKIISSIILKEGFQDLETFPFFDEKGSVIIQPKSTTSIIRTAY